MDLAWLCLFAFLAGFVDSIVGGGGLIQLPALFVFLPKELAANVPLVFGTNKLSSLCGTSVAVLTDNLWCSGQTANIMQQVAIIIHFKLYLY